MRLINSLSVSGKRVLVRCDFDVPLTDQGEVADAFRLEKALKTINYLLKEGARVVLMGHLGRPEGKFDQKDSLAPVAGKMSELLGQEILLVKEPWSEEGRREVAFLSAKKIVLLENLRFHPGEEKNDLEFAKQLANFGEIYVNDAFANSHRSHASMVGVPEILPGYAGITLAREVEVLSSALMCPAKPLVAIIGGAKIETKLPAITNLAKMADQVLVGGRLLMEEIPLLPKVVFPEDVIVAKNESPDSTDITVKEFKSITAGELVLDIGSKARRTYSDLIQKAGTVIWNGPLGLFEDARFEEGTKQIASAITSSSAQSIVGGGETIEALEKFQLLDEIGHVSTGGGAMLEFLAGKKLPGIEALEN